jgi:hypothetical protein
VEEAQLLRRVLLTVCVALVAAALMAAAKPTPTPKLGVPHVVTDEYLNGTYQADVWRTVRCPAGEVALSWAVKGYAEDGSDETPQANSATYPQSSPVVENGRPVGYLVTFRPNVAFMLVRTYVTCATAT